MSVVRRTFVNDGRAQNSGTAGTRTLAESERGLTVAMCSNAVGRAVNRVAICGNDRDTPVGVARGVRQLGRGA